MRKFLQYAKEKKSCSTVGAKIWEDKNDWVLMIPDQYSERGEALHKKYLEKIKIFSKKQGTGLES